MKNYNWTCYFYSEYKDMGSSTPTCLRYEDNEIGVCPCENCESYLSKKDATIIVRKYVNGELKEV